MTVRIVKPQALDRRPRVTVVIPHYNYGQFLPVAVASALDQEGLDLEIVIVDDSSTDGSREVADKLAVVDPRITLVAHEQNMGHIRTYNDGLSRAQGDYVVLLSADDALTPNSLTRSVALMEAQPEVGLVYGPVVWFNGDPPPINKSGNQWKIWSGKEWIGHVAHRGRNTIVNPEVVMRRSVYEQTGGYNEEFPHAGDMYMWLQAATHADIGFISGQPQAYYRDHGGNMHATRFDGLLDDMEQVRDVYSRFFDLYGAGIPGASDMRRVAMRSVAREALLRGAQLASQDSSEGSLLTVQSFASRMAPEVVGSLAWHWSTLCGQPLGRKVVGAVEDLRWKLRYRRHLALGL